MVGLVGKTIPKYERERSCGWRRQKQDIVEDAARQGGGARETEFMAAESQLRLNPLPKSCQPVTGIVYLKEELPTRYAKQKGRKMNTLDADDFQKPFLFFALKSSLITEKRPDAPKGTGPLQTKD